ncbi:hypothetical protein F4V43_01820 [Paenibacillus spiritus]|uniref:Uncharacterized protein n=1 Tax=Paenibacillus spiritus TaxID=2496557 RepID=A0A5J5GGA6_9BACL|nr:hypothetical protein [Paenibacillus spiritus]KAA9007249.1 hypothetical protein F4V43_01820 [Paenibacillus spiritus]
MSDALSDGLPDDNKFDWECESCEKEFEVEVEFTPNYSADKIVWYECDVCNKKTRDIYKEGKIFPFPKALIGKEVCYECWIHTYAKELNNEGIEES